MFNFDADTIFFDTNARKAHTGSEIVRSPTYTPVVFTREAPDTFDENVKWAAVSSTLWFVSYTLDAKPKD